MRVLVTNDDGIDAEGLHALVRAAADAGHEVVVAAPARQASGSGAAVLIDPEPGDADVPVGRIRIEERTVEGAVSAWAVSASPAICVRLGLGGSFGEPPALVLSGVNPGANTGRVLLHSGTVGAALTAGVMGVRAIAVSLDELEDDVPHLFDQAAELAVSLVDTVLAEPDGTVLNLNVPNAAGPHPLAEAPLDSAGIVHTTTPDADADAGDLSVAVALDAERTADPGSDVDLLTRGTATLTAIVPPHAIPLRAPLP